MTLVMDTRNKKLSVIMNSEPAEIAFSEVEGELYFVICMRGVGESVEIINSS